MNYYRDNTLDGPVEYLNEGGEGIKIYMVY
jgi:hypothetical protein